MAIEFTQSVGSSTLQITLCFSMSSNSAFTLSRSAGAGIVLLLESAGGGGEGLQRGNCLVYLNVVEFL